MITTAELQALTGPIFAEIVEALGQPIEIRHLESGGAFTLTGERNTLGGSTWVGRGVLVPLTDKQAQDAGSIVPVPVQQLFLPPDAPVGRPGFTVRDPVTDLSYRPIRDAIDWKGIFWDMLVQAPGERSA